MFMKVDLMPRSSLQKVAQLQKKLVASILKPSFMEKLVNVAKAPQDDVETFSESHGDVVTAPKSPHDAIEDDQDEEDLIAKLEKPINMQVFSIL